jgi:transketolase
MISTDYEMIAIRQAYGESLVDLGRNNSSVVVLDADVAHSTRSIEFHNTYPDRFFNFGIAEANMVSAAAGMAAMGKIPFVNSFSFLIAERALDQVRSAVAYTRMNVKLAGHYGGLSDSFDGASHHSISDIAIMRSIPNMVVVVISDAIMMKNALPIIAGYSGPVYIRLCREKTPVIHSGDTAFELGKGILLADGFDMTIIVTGILVYRVMLAHKKLAEIGIFVRVIEIHTIKPLDIDLIVNAACDTGAILTCEEATVMGGLGSAVAEAVSRFHPVLMDYIGLNDCYAESGAYDRLLDLYGMSFDNIVNKAIALISKKRTRAKQL